MIQVGQLLQTNTYKAQLQSEEWRSFASGIRASRGNTCECCRQSGVQTQVHHIFYEGGLKLWEYDPQDVILLCSGCHKALHEQLKNFRKHVFRHMRPENLQILNGALAVGLKGNDPTEFVHAVAEMARSPRSVIRFAYAWNNGKKPEIESKFRPAASNNSSPPLNNP